ncbi:MAG: hypothetical protein LOX97_07590 [Sphingomonas sp.]|nr:hypothetical protein [Sphingomonas sp.]
MRIGPVSMLLLLCAGLGSTPSLAKDDKPGKTKDPNEVVCEKQSIIGSRLATRRVCATRAEWAEKRRLDKEAIDQGQRSACMVTTTSSSGRASC